MKSEFVIVIKNFKIALLASLPLIATNASFAGYAEGVAAFDKKDYKAAFSELKPLADAGDGEAQNYVGLMYEYGSGIKKDEQEAAKWYEKSLLKGSGEGSWNFGRSQLYDIGVKGDKNLAYLTFLILTSKGDERAAYAAGIMESDGKYPTFTSYPKAIAHFKQAAEKGSVNALYELGLVYAKQGNDGEALKYYDQAAEKGDLDALYEAGEIYSKQGNNGQSLYYLKQAADRGNVRAIYKLGVMYFKGDGVDEDGYEAVRYFRLAVNAGSLDAINALGAAYRSGVGVPQNKVIAYALFSKAVQAASDEFAGRNIEKISEEMSDKEVSVAVGLSKKMSEKNGILAVVDKYVSHPIVKEGWHNAAVTSNQNSTYPPRPSKRPGVTSCNTNCMNGECFRTYDNGRKKHFFAPQKFNPLTNGFEWDAGSC